MSNLHPALSFLYPGRLMRLMAPAILLFGIYAVYLWWSVTFVSSGYQDPIYRLSGVPRTYQLVYATFLLLVYGALAALFNLRSRAWSDPRRQRAELTILTGLLFLNFFAASFPATLRELHTAHLTLLLGYLGLVLALQSIAVFAMLSIVRRSVIAATLLAVLAILNAYALHIVLREDFHESPGATKLLILGALFLAFLTLFSVIGKGLFSARPVNIVLVLTLVGAPANVLREQIDRSVSSARLAPFGEIVFREKPDVYVIGFESMTPTAIARKYMELDELEHDSALREMGAHLFSNAFASVAPTKLSLNSVMALAQPGIQGEFDYFAGRLNSPLAAVFARNGYRLSTGYGNQYFGQQGVFVDKYYPDGASSISENSLCGLATYSIWKMFGFCDLFSGYGRREGSWPQKIKNSIAEAKSLKRPSFMFFHMSPLGHTSSDYRTDDRAAFQKFRNKYRNLSRRAAGILRELAAIVRQDGRRSIMLVLGDHGPWLSRSITFDENADFFVQDRYGVRMAVAVNETDCDAAALQHYSKTYTTPERVIAGLLRCLAVEPGRVDKAVGRFQESWPFEQFLYE